MGQRSETSSRTPGRFANVIQDHALAGINVAKCFIQREQEAPFTPGP